MNVFLISCAWVRRELAGGLLLLVGWVGSLSAATYYVDYGEGSDLADGLSPGAAWKHSPGDHNAGGRPKGVALVGGDRVVFKGGVAYGGEIEVRVSGTEGKPITWDGNVAGAYGVGRAILDGARTIRGWKAVESAEMVLGNPRWRDIRYADLDVDLSSNFNTGEFVLHRDNTVARQAPWQRLFLIDGQRRVLPIAQQPKPSDPFYPDLPAGFYSTAHPLTDDYPHRLIYEEGTRGNRSTPLISIVSGGPNAPVIQPLNGGKVSVALAKQETVAEFGFTLFRPATTPAPEQVVFFVDDQEVIRVSVNAGETRMQRFALPHPVTVRKLTFQPLTSDPKAPAWTKLQQIAAFDPTGRNVLQHPISSLLQDEERITQADPSWYERAFIGVHGGNNHVYFARVAGYEPGTGRLRVPHFNATTYPKTNYALFNSPRFLEQPGEWCLQPLESGKTRVFLLPETAGTAEPADIGYPVGKNAIMLDGGASHIEVRGFLIQRYAAGSGGVATRGRGGARPHHLTIADCEVRFISGNAGISLNQAEEVVVEDCLIHHCPGWTVGIYVNRVNGFRLSRNRLETNSGSGIRHYESARGVIEGNVILNHFGMHSSALNLYEGCRDIRIEGNYLQNVIAINRNAENLVFRNNVVDGMGRAAVTVALWNSGRVGGRALKHLHFLNNTFVNTDRRQAWSGAIFGQSAQSPSPPEGLIIRNNLLDGLSEDLPGIIEGNLYTRKVEDRFMGPGCEVYPDLNVLFLNPAAGDYRRKPGGPKMEVGAEVEPPVALGLE
ncbi:MAG: right-handed parallel beta-helix repeat-containing protein [Opitutaceae bacterium]